MTAEFPKTETYALVDQIRRASYSVPANIVEGQARNTTKEYLSFLYNARGSAEEVRYFLLLSKSPRGQVLTFDILDTIFSKIYNKIVNRN